MTIKPGTQTIAANHYAAFTANGCTIEVQETISRLSNTVIGIDTYKYFSTFTECKSYIEKKKGNRNQKKCQ